jgi:predicted deacylase
MLKALLKRQKERDGFDCTEAYDITSARLPGRAIITFEKRGGAVAALEVTERGAEILRGIAAGAVQSEIEEVRSGVRTVPLSRDEGASREQAEAFIQSLDLLDHVEKSAMLGALPR